MTDRLVEKEEEVTARLNRELGTKMQNQESERKKEEERERKLVQRVDILVKKFKGYVWQLALPGLFLNGLAEEAVRRRFRSLKEITSAYPLILESLKNSCRNIAQKGLIDVLFYDSAMGL